MAEDDRVKVDAFVDEEGKRVPFVLKITEPRKSDEEKDYYCEIFAPKLFQNTKKIYGVNESQAKELALEFVKSLLNGRPLFDKDGKVISLDSGKI